ncbi:MAG: histidine kinase dimerization/phospho-acceptor domain-containing protein [Verrucomicrobiota bacterium]
MVLLIVPDTFFYTDPSYSLKYWLNLANTGLDFLLFTTVFVFLKKEIRKRRALNEQLAAANRLKTEFLQIAAHDLRNPLNAVSLVASEIPSPQKDGESNPGEEIRSSANEMLLL